MQAGSALGHFDDCCAEGPNVDGRGVGQREENLWCHPMRCSVQAAAVWLFSGELKSRIRKNKGASFIGETGLVTLDKSVGAHGSTMTSKKTFK